MIVSPEEVLGFWFKECEPSDWFKKLEGLDTEIRTRFLPTYEAIVSGETVHWRKTPRGRLADWINSQEIFFVRMQKLLLRIL